MGVSNCYGGDDGLTGFYLGEMDFDFVAFIMNIHRAFIRMAIMGLCPDVEIMDNRTVVDSHIEDAETFSIGHPVPRFGEKEFHGVVAGCSREMETQIVTTETAGAENGRKGIVDRLGCLIGREQLITVFHKTL